jgi:hypothetical protein
MSAPLSAIVFEAASMGARERGNPASRRNPAGANREGCAVTAPARKEKS